LHAALSVLSANMFPSWKFANAIPVRVTAIEFGVDWLGHEIVPMFLNWSEGG
jgi:hypothetical protein